MAQSRRTSDNYIVFSDVHLGADLVQHARPWTIASLRRAARIDRELATMLDHYRVSRDGDRPWCLVIAGDLVDFIGMSIAPCPGDAFQSKLSEEELLHGLGSTEEHAVAKMRAVALRHSLVFERLAAFVADGNSLVLVRGNHDVDFHWESARAAFVEAMIERLPDVAADATARAALESRIEFAPWFYYVEGLLYVEHGHQYDAMCSYLSPLVPLSPIDPSRIGWSISDILLRWVVRPTPGLSSEGHEDRGTIHYLRFAVNMGVRGAARLGMRYAKAITHLVGNSRIYFGDRAAWLRAEHERRMGELARRWQVGVGAIRALGAEHARPTASRIWGILSSLLVDRLALVVLGTLALGLVWLVAPEIWSKLGVSAGLVSMLGLVYVRLRKARQIDPSHALRRGAEHVARLFPTRYVVMGHTHEPGSVRVANDTTYFNVGAWAIDDSDLPDNLRTDAPRTHLVIRHVDGQPLAELIRWDPESGPYPLPDRAPERPLARTR